MVQKKTLKIWHVAVDNVVISKLIEPKNSSKYLIVIRWHRTYDAIRPVVLILPKMSGYVKTFKDKIIN